MPLGLRIWNNLQMIFGRQRGITQIPCMERFTLKSGTFLCFCPLSFHYDPSWCLATENFSRTLSPEPGNWVHLAGDYIDSTFLLAINPIFTVGHSSSSFVFPKLQVSSCYDHAMFVLPLSRRLQFHSGKFISFTLGSVFSQAKANLNWKPINNRLFRLSWPPPPLQMAWSSSEK